MAQPPSPHIMGAIVPTREEIELFQVQMEKARIMNAPVHTNEEFDTFREILAKERATAATTTTTVVHIQRKGGQIVQDCDVYIGRAVSRGGWNLPQSKWANPFTIAKEGSVERAIEAYESHLLKSPELMASLGELRGKVLGCWCKPGPCHGDILAKWADKK